MKNKSGLIGRLFGAAALIVAISGFSRVSAAENTQGVSTVLDPLGDALFPYNLYNAPVPPYLDMVRVSVTSSREVFRFEVQMSVDVPANADPGFTPAVNHLGVTVGVLTDRKTAGSPFKFFGQTDTYPFNFFVGALYSPEDSGAGLDLGWSGFLIDLATFTVTEIPLRVRGDTLIFETTAASLGNPASFEWAAGAECDPVTIPEEKRKSAVLVDFVPDHGMATWPQP